MKTPYPLVLGFLLLTCCSPGLIGDQVARTQQTSLFDAKLYNKVAVFVMDRSGVFRHPALLRQVEDEFLHELLGKGYMLAARSDLNKIMTELRIQTSMITEKDAARIGHILNASAIVLVSVNDASLGDDIALVKVNGKDSHYTTKVNISARMLDTRQAQVLWSSTFTGSYYGVSVVQEEDSLVALPLVARIVAKELPARTPTSPGEAAPVPAEVTMQEQTPCPKEPKKKSGKKAVQATPPIGCIEAAAKNKSGEKSGTSKASKKKAASEGNSIVSTKESNTGTEKMPASAKKQSGSSKKKAVGTKKPPADTQAASKPGSSQPVP